MEQDRNGVHFIYKILRHNRNIIKYTYLKDTTQ